MSLLISDLARASGVSVDTIRFYERKGVLARPARTASGYRSYAPEAVERVRLVRRAAAVGFTLAELARVLRARDTGGVPCRGVRALAADKLAELDRRVRELRDARRELAAIIEDWDRRLASTPAGQQARLLDTLEGDHAAAARRTDDRQHPAGSPRRRQPPRKRRDGLRSGGRDAPFPPEA